MADQVGKESGSVRQGRKGQGRKESGSVRQGRKGQVG